MAIYARCLKCKRDNPTTSKCCKHCSTKLGERFSVRVRDSQTGKWRTKSVPSLKLAKEVEAKLKVKQIEGSLFDKAKANDFSFERYLKHSELTKKSWRGDRNRYKNYIASKDYHTPKGIQAILYDMGHLSPQTRKHVLNLIRRAYNWHIEQGLYHSDNPCRNIRIPKFDNRVSNILSREQVNVLIDYLNKWENRRAALVILFAIYTGRRKSEIVGLRWSDVNLEHGYITCRNTKNGSSLSFPLNTKALAVLEEAHSIAINSLCFPSSSGHHYYSGISLAWGRLRKRLKRSGMLDICSIRFHDLRHTYASFLASSGKVDIYTLKKLLGHKDISLTERYSHLSDGRLRRSTKVLDELF